MNSENLLVLTKIMGGVETGEQKYGKSDYARYTPPGKNTDNEVTITLGWWQAYAHEARQLVQAIFDADPNGFRKLDTAGIEGMLSKDWEKLKWNPSSAQKAVLIKLIDSPTGHAVQDKMFADKMVKLIADCAKDYTSDIKAQMMYCEIRHLGGREAVNRIFNRCKGKFDLDTIMASLAHDQLDNSSDNQVGDKIYWSRHLKCRQWIDEYAVDETEKKEEEKTMATPMSRAKTFLRQPENKTMTGYTPTGSGYFKSANAWTTVPKKGYVVYFYGKPAGEGYRICHTGIVEWVNTSTKAFGTVEGNSSSSEFTTNGGCVARHTYSYASVGGSNRVNGFGIPDFAGAGISADDYVKTAVSYIGYEEKKSNADLDDFHKNAGGNNYQKFQRDVTGYTGDQWCQYFVDAIALYAAQGSKGEDPTPVPMNQVFLYQKWLNTTYKEYVIKAVGELLKTDGDYGKLTRAASVAVWKYMANKYYGSMLTIGNANFFDSCRKVAAKMTTNECKKHPTLVYIIQGVLAGRGFYSDTVDGSYGPNTTAAIKALQKKAGLSATGTMNADTWYVLFN